MTRFAHAALSCVAWAAAAPLLAPSTAAAAPPLASAARESYDIKPPLQFELFGHEEGLPSPWVTSIVQDSHGFLWFGTQAGAARHDGRRVRVWRADPDDPAAIGSSLVSAMAASPDGAVWIGTGDAGLYRHDSATDRLTAFRARSGALAQDAITTIFVDSKERVWVGAGAVLHRFDAREQRFERYPLGAVGAVSYVTALCEERGALWVGTDTGLYRMDPSDGDVLEQHEGFPGSVVQAVTVDRGGVVWVGTDEGLFRRAPGQETFTLFAAQGGRGAGLTDMRITVLFEDSTRNLWVGTASGLNRLGPERDRIDRFEMDSKYWNETVSYPRLVNAVFQDDGGVVWIGTQIGARKLVPLRERFHRYVMSGVTGLGLSFAEAPDGALWVGSWNSGLQRMDRASGKITLHRSLGSAEGGDLVPLTNWLRALALDEHGVLWISEDDVGLVRLDTRTGAHEVHPVLAGDQAGPVPPLMNLAVEGRFVWIATWGLGLLRFDTTSKELLDFPDMRVAGPPVDHVYAVTRDRRDPGALWLGAAGAGLQRFDTRTQRAKYYPIAPRQAGDDPSDVTDVSVHHVHQADDGALWLATDGMGLVRLDPITGKTTAFSTRAGLPSRVVYGVYPDRKGRLWLPTDTGLAAFHPGSGRAIVFDKADGAATVFSLGCFYQSPSGELFLSAAMDAVLAFRPEEIELTRSAPRVSLVSFKALGQEVRIDRPLWNNPAVDLAFFQKAISFEFAALTYAAPGRIRYRYRLDGLEDEWTETALAFASYTNLGGGDYVFRVQAADRDGDWQESGVALPIHLASPPWATWWAYTLYGGGLLGLALLLVRHQSMRVERARRAARLQSAERELEIAAAVQTGFLPHKSRLTLPHFELQGFYRAASRASGDWWWYEAGADGRWLAVLVGDVTGHGAAAAMVTAAAATAFRMGSMHDIQIARRLRDLNRTVLEVSRGEYLMTMTSVVLDGRTGEFTFDSAGGQPVMVLDHGGTARLLTCRGTPLGTRQEFAAGRLQGRVGPGDRLVLFTDGMPELSLDASRMLGMRRFARLCEETGELPLDEAVARLVDDLDERRGARPQEDDWTIAMVQYTG